MRCRGGSGYAERAAIAGCALVMALNSSAHSATFWSRGVESKTITICFVGDAVTARPDRVQQILTYIKEYEYAANVRFSSLGGCPAASSQPNGDDFYDGDIRVVIPGISVKGNVPLPGKGCPSKQAKKKDANSGWGSWSNAPNELKSHRSCLYNLKLGDNPWNSIPYLNHTLHEIGHALGFTHEHQRNDVDHSICSAPGFGGNIATGFLTPYDRYSVMHYRKASCGINGNYDNTGLSSRDRIAVHILYPEDVRVAEFAGTTVVTTGRKLVLGSAWKRREAFMQFVAHDFTWKLHDNVVGTGADLSVQLDAGVYPIQYAYKDFLGRSYSYAGTVHVMTPETFARQISGPIAARAALQ